MSLSGRSSGCVFVRSRDRADAGSAGARVIVPARDHDRAAAALNP